MMFAVPLVALVVAVLPPLPADLVVAIGKQVKVQGAVVVIGRRSGDAVQIEELGQSNGPKADEHTLFEIDGITETITGLLLAESVRRGEVRLDEPVAELHDADLHPPSRAGAPVTLADLAAHRTAFPHLSLGQSAQP
jgi:CubicO group peptidase (beta-lactamase class C family)